MALGLFALEAHRLPAPDLLQIVEIAHRRMHDVHDHVAEVDEHPLAARFALDAVDAHAVLPDFLLHAVRQRLDLARRVAARDYHALEHRRHAPGVELCVLIASQDQIQLRISIGPQALERVYGVTGSAGGKLARVDLVERLALDREPEHRDAVLARRDRRVAVARCSGGHPQQLVEIELAHGGARHREVRVVNRIESAAEDAYFQVRTSPWPSTTNFWVVRPSRPTGPRACSLSVEMPTSAPRPYS